jgi:hypothetical protein
VSLIAASLLVGCSRTASAPPPAHRGADGKVCRETGAGHPLAEARAAGCLRRRTPAGFNSRGRYQTDSQVGIGCSVYPTAGANEGAGGAHREETNAGRSATRQA